MTAETVTATVDGATGGSADDDGWVTAGRDHHGQGRKSTDANRDTTKPTAPGGGKWKEDGSSGASGGKREGSRRSKYGGGKDGWGKAEGEGGRERRDRDGRRDGWGGGKQWVDGDGGGKTAANGDAASGGARADGGDGGRRAGTGRAQRDGIPTRPAGRGFTMGRGKNGGQALELSLGALKVSSVSDAFYESIVAKKAAKGQFADAEADADAKAETATAADSSSEAKTEESAEPTKSTVTYRYDALELVTILRQLEEANACVLPEDVCGTNVPLKTIKPGDALWELTMLGRHGDWSKTTAAAQSTTTAPPEPKTTTTTGKSKDDNIPEWAQEGNSLADASITDDGFLGGTLPELTPEERLGLAGLVQPSNGAAAPQRTSSRFVALEEEETLMPHMSHIGSMMQPPPQQQQQQQQQQPPPMQMPPMRMPPQQQQQQQQQQPPPVPMNVDWLYLDPQQQQQGPFSRQELIEWHQGGFFPNDLPCKPVDAPPGAPFMPLIELLQNGWRYGIPMQQPPPQQQQQQPQGGGLPPWLAQQGQQPPGGPPPQQMQAPRGRTLEEIEQSHGIARAPPQQGQQPPKTNVLANFAAGLGISSQAGAMPPAAKGMTLAELEGRHMHDQASRLEVASADASHKWDAPPAARDLPPAQMPPTQMPPRPEPMPEPPKPSGPAWGGAAPTPPPQAAGKTLLDIQREEEARAAAAAKNAPPPNMNTAFGGAWGAGSAGSGKSLKQIQDEEAAAAARRAAQAAEQQQAVATSGGWAAAAATGVVQPKPAPPAPRPMAVPRTVPAPRPAVAAPNVPTPLTSQPPAPSVATPGGSPPLNDKNALRRWCKMQMSQLNNSDDMTLVDFLLGLPSAGEVQEYVALYLGKTPQAAAFAAELIRQKRADPSLANGLGNGEMAKVAAQTGGSAVGGGFTDDVDDDAGWSSASKKKGR